MVMWYAFSGMLEWTEIISIFKWKHISVDEATDAWNTSTGFFQYKEVAIVAFGWLYLQTFSFGRYQKLITIDENINQPVNPELNFLSTTTL